MAYERNKAIKNIKTAILFYLLLVVSTNIERFLPCSPIFITRKEETTSFMGSQLKWL